MAPALAAFATGLPAFTLAKIFQPSFYAREDTKTPMYFAFATVAANIAASLILSSFMGHVGIALATSVAAWLNAGLLIFVALRRGYYRSDARFASRFLRMLASLAVMSLTLWVLLNFLLEPDYAEGAGFGAALSGLLILLGSGVASYFAAAHVTGAFRLSELRAMLRR